MLYGRPSPDQKRFGEHKVMYLSEAIKERLDTIAQALGGELIVALGTPDPDGSVLRSTSARQGRLPVSTT